MGTQKLDTVGALGSGGGHRSADRQADEPDPLLCVRSVTPEAITRCGTIDRSQFQDAEREQWEDLTWAAAVVRGESSGENPAAAYRMLDNLSRYGATATLQLAAANAARSGRALELTA